MKSRGILRGLVIRIACSLFLATFALVGSVNPVPEWVNWIVLVLQRPLAAVYFTLFPSQDSFIPAVLPWLSSGFFISLGFTMSLYLLISYLPNLCALVWRTTRRAMHTPGAFLGYASAGAILGGMAGLLLWAALTETGSQTVMYKVVVGSGLTVGWFVAVFRCALERRLGYTS